MTNSRKRRKAQKNRENVGTIILGGFIAIMVIFTFSIVIYDIALQYQAIYQGSL